MPTMRHTRSAALAAACFAACACQERQGQANEAANAANAAQQKMVPEIPLPTPEPPLERQQLLVAAMQAASDYAVSANDAESQSDLAGRNFEFRIRFGCESATAKGDYGSTFDGASGVLKVRAAPSLSSNDPAVKAIAGDAFEAAEGFWIMRPWLVTAACPLAKRPATAPTTHEQPDSHILGIAQFFTAAGPRTMRRSGRPYEATKKLDPGDEPKGGFDLVLSGRLVALPDGRVIACSAAETGDRPICVISAEFGKVWIERADTKEHLADWGTG